MPEEIKENPIEIRSEEVEDIMSRPPRWIVRRGIMLLFIIVILLLAGSWFFKYPDVIATTITITTSNPPGPVVSKATGKIMTLYVKDQQKVKAGDYLAVIENPANINAINSLKTCLTDSLPNKKLIGQIRSISSQALGDLQSAFTEWLKSIQNYERFIQYDVSHQKVAALEEQTRLTNQYIDRLQTQSTLQKNDFHLSNKQYRRDSLLYCQKVISEADYDQSESKIISKQYAFESSRATLINTKIQLSQLHQQTLDLEMQYNEQQKQLSEACLVAVRNLKNQLQVWEQMYVLKSPAGGTVVASHFWSVNQQVKAGEQVFTVVPEDKPLPVAKIILPVQGAGKVKPGQKVNIKLANYPYTEFGMVEGKVVSVSLVPADNNYSVEVALPNGLQTNYGKTLPFSNEMTGTAEIVTEDMRLLERFFNPIKAVLKNQ